MKDLVNECFFIQTYKAILNIPTADKFKFEAHVHTYNITLLLT